MSEEFEGEILLGDTEMVRQHPDGGIICKRHGRDPIRSHCAACEIEFELLEERDD